jgi:hypothetical protein
MTLEDVTLWKKTRSVSLIISLVSKLTVLFVKQNSMILPCVQAVSSPLNLEGEGKNQSEHFKLCKRPASVV